jgi:hypothetical protein
MARVRHPSAKWSDAPKRQICSLSAGMLSLEGKKRAAHSFAAAAIAVPPAKDSKHPETPQ